MILVTGGAGFIGSALIAELNAGGRGDIIIADTFGEDDKWLNVRDLQFEEFITIDHLFNEAYSDVLASITTIYHMGACSTTTETNMDFLWFNNVDYSKNLITLATDLNIPICYASSAATYGDGAEGFSDAHGEIRKLKPLNKYGWSKQVVDEWLLASPEKPAHWYGIKFFNVYGPNEYHKGGQASVVFHAFNQINKTNQMKLFKSNDPTIKDGEQKRDFVYVKDVCRAMIELVEKNESSLSGIYNMGTGGARTFYDLTKATFSAMKKDEKVEFIDMPENLKAQYQNYTQAGMEKLMKALPDFQFHSLEDGVKDYVQNYLLQTHPYLSVR